MLCARLWASATCCCWWWTSRISSDEEDRHAVDLVRKASTPTLLMLNKVDLLHKDKSAVLPLIEQYRALYEFADYVPISARKGDGLAELRQGIVDRLSGRPGIFSARTTSPISPSASWPPN